LAFHVLLMPMEENFDMITFYSIPCVKFLTGMYIFMYFGESCPSKKYFFKSLPHLNNCSEFLVV